MKVGPFSPVGGRSLLVGKKKKLILLLLQLLLLLLQKLLLVLRLKEGTEAITRLKRRLLRLLGLEY